jgi:hypothetical protein
LIQRLISESIAPAKPETRRDRETTCCEEVYREAER